MTITSIKSLVKELLEKELEEASGVGGGMVSATGGSPLGINMKSQHKTLWSGDKPDAANEHIVKDRMEQGITVPSPSDVDLLDNSDQQDLEEKRSRSRMAVPTIYYHGTSTKFLPNIINNGLSPKKSDKKNIWQDEDRSLDSLEGVYLGRSHSLAMNYAKDTASRFGGNPAVLSVQIVPQTGLADEDLINTTRVLKNVITRLYKQDSSLWLGLYWFLKSDELEEIRNTFIQEFHRFYSRNNPKIPLNSELLNFAFETTAADDIKDIPEIFFGNWLVSYANLESIFGNDKGTMSDKDFVTAAEILADEILTRAEQAGSERRFKEMQIKLTKYYAGNYRGVQPTSFRINQTIGFSGRNKIVGIVVLEPKTEKWHVLYGQPHDAAKLGGGVMWEPPSDSYATIREALLQKKDMVRTLIDSLTENVLDKMGLSKATSNIRRGALSGEVYMDRHDSDKATTKKIVKKVARNLNKKPYSHDPPVMGLKESFIAQQNVPQLYDALMSSGLVDNETPIYINFHGPNKLAMALSPDRSGKVFGKIYPHKQTIELPTDIKYWKLNPHIASGLLSLSATLPQTNDFKVVVWNEENNQNESTGLTLSQLRQMIKKKSVKAQETIKDTDDNGNPVTSFKEFMVDILEDLDDRTWYHATRKLNLESIKKQGLLPSHTFEQGQGWTQANLNLQNAVYLTADIEYAYAIAETLAIRNKEDGVVLAVSGKALEDKSKIVLDEDALVSQDGMRWGDIDYTLPDYYTSVLNKIRSIGYSDVISPKYISVEEVVEFESEENI